MSDISTLAVRAIVPVFVALCFGVARKYLKPPAPLSEAELSELDSRFRQTKWVVGPSVFAVGAAFAWAAHGGLVSLNHYLATSDGSETTLRLWPQTAIWWFFPGFGALTLCWDITLLVWSFLDKSGRATLYRSWSDGRAGFDCTRVLRWMVILITAPIAFASLLALPIHAAIRQGDIRQCGYAWTRCQTFEYSRAVRMTQIEGYRDREGKLERRAGIVVDFNDGRRWSSAEIGDFREGVDPKLESILTERIRLPLNQAQTESDIPNELP